MSALHGRLNAVIEADRGRFSGEEFAAARLGAVAGSVKRRRAVRSTGVGGASVLGASALAAGVMNVPWGSLGVAAPGSSPGVICTTTTPDAVAGEAVKVPVGATQAVVDNATGAVFFVGLVDGHVTIWKSDGTEVPIEDKEGPVELLLPSGELVTIEKDEVSAGLSITPSDPSAVAILGAHEYAAQQNLDSEGLSVAEISVPGNDGEAAATWEVSSGGAVVAKAHRDGDTLVVEQAGDNAQRVQRSDDGGYHFDVDGEPIVISVSELSGEEIAVGVVYGDETATAEPSVAPSPVVACVTPSPGPSQSASASPSPSTSPEPSVTPSTIAEVTSAFQCGFDFTTYGYEAGDVIAETELTTQAAIRATFLDWYGEQAPTTEVPDSDAPAWHAVLNPDVSVEDASLFRFVAVKDGVVVGTIDSITNNAPGYVADGDGDAALEAFLWDRGALTACGTTSIEEAEIYAVFALDSGDAGDFAWRPVTE